MLIVSALVSGLSLGAMYGLIALGYHVTYAVSNTVNFSQGSSVMLGAVLCYTLWVTLGAPLAVAIIGALALAALFGLVVERFLVRPFAARGSNAWLMATVAGGIKEGVPPPKNTVLKCIPCTSGSWASWARCARTAFR